MSPDPDAGGCPECGADLQATLTAAGTVSVRRLDIRNPGRPQVVVSRSEFLAATEPDLEDVRCPNCRWVLRRLGSNSLDWTH